MKLTAKKFLVIWVIVFAILWMAAITFYPHVVPSTVKEFSYSSIRAYSKYLIAVVPLLVALYFLWFFRSAIASGFQKGWKAGFSSVRGLRSGDFLITGFSRTASQVESDLEQARGNRDRAIGKAREVFALRVEDLERELATFRRFHHRLRETQGSMPKRDVVSVAAELSTARKNRDGQKSGTIEHLRFNVRVQALKIELVKLQGKGDGKRNVELVNAELELARVDRNQHTPQGENWKRKDKPVQRLKAELAALQKKK